MKKRIGSSAEVVNRYNNQFGDRVSDTVEELKGIGIDIPDILDQEPTSLADIIHINDQLKQILNSNFDIDGGDENQKFTFVDKPIGKWSIDEFMEADPLEKTFLIVLAGLTFIQVILIVIAISPLLL